MKATRIVACGLCLLSSAALADDAAELAKKSLNPIAALYSLPLQYNWDQKMGPLEKACVRSPTYNRCCRSRSMMTGT